MRASVVLSLALLAYTVVCQYNIVPSSDYGSMKLYQYNRLAVEFRIVHTSNNSDASNGLWNSVYHTAEDTIWQDSGVASNLLNFVSTGPDSVWVTYFPAGLSPYIPNPTAQQAFPLTVNSGAAPYSVQVTASPLSTYKPGGTLDLTLNFYKGSTVTTNERVRVRAEPAGCIQHAAFNTDSTYRYFGKKLRVNMSSQGRWCSISFIPQSNSNYVGVSNWGGRSDSSSANASGSYSIPTANAIPSCVSCSSGSTGTDIFGCPKCN